MTTFKVVQYGLEAVTKNFQTVEYAKKSFYNSLEISLYRRGVKSFLDAYLGK